jgi:hypothetical protein
MIRSKFPKGVHSLREVFLGEIYQFPLLSRFQFSRTWDETLDGKYSLPTQEFIVMHLRLDSRV